MNIHTVIKKYTISEFAGLDYWGNFGLLPRLPLRDDQFLKLIDFYSATENYKNRTLNIISNSDGYGYRFASTPGSLTVYNHFGVINPYSIRDIIRKGSEFTDFIASRDALFLELGWTGFEEKLAVVPGDFDDDNFTFTNELISYQEIETLYNTAPSLESFLGTLA